MSSKWKCMECGKEFSVGDWTCADGSTNHSVLEKVYRACDPPQDPGYADTKGTPLPTSSFGETVVCNVPPPRKVIRQNGEVSWEGEGSVVFIRGRYSTRDPEKQYWLDQKPSYNRTEDDWCAAWQSQEQRLKLKEIELLAREQRLESERNELLSMTKQKVGAGR